MRKLLFTMLFAICAMASAQTSSPTIECEGTAHYIVGADGNPQRVNVQVQIYSDRTVSLDRTMYRGIDESLDYWIAELCPAPEYTEPTNANQLRTLMLSLGFIEHIAPGDYIDVGSNSYYHPDINGPEVPDGVYNRRFTRDGGHYITSLRGVNSNFTSVYEAIELYLGRSVLPTEPDTISAVGTGTIMIDIPSKTLSVSYTGEYTHVQWYFNDQSSGPSGYVAHPGSKVYPGHVDDLTGVRNSLRSLSAVLFNAGTTVATLTHTIGTQQTPPVAVIYELEDAYEGTFQAGPQYIHVLGDEVSRYYCDGSSPSVEMYGRFGRNNQFFFRVSNQPVQVIKETNGSIFFSGRLNGRYQVAESAPTCEEEEEVAPPIPPRTGSTIQSYYNDIPDFDDLSAYVDAFNLDLQRAGITPVGLATGTIRFSSSLPAGVHGRASQFQCYDDAWTVDISRNGWDARSDKEKLALVYHELGHAILKLSHTCGGARIMRGPVDAGTPDADLSNSECQALSIHTRLTSGDDLGNWKIALADMFTMVPSYVLPESCPVSSLTNAEVVAGLQAEGLTFNQDETFTLPNSPQGLYIRISTTGGTRSLLLFDERNPQMAGGVRYNLISVAVEAYRSILTAG